MPAGKHILSSSFRDPSGFVFLEKGVLYRRICKSYKEHYDHLMSSGLYDVLTNRGLLIRHQEMDTIRSCDQEEYRTIRPEVVPFISYPYEWCFSQLRDAALATLEIQKIALDYGMTLKDASSFNMQFKKGSPTLIDTLSFEKYREGQPWLAYRQFCQHFLAPLALMHYKDVRLNQLLSSHIDGIPLDMASGLLPAASKWRIPILFHIHLHAKKQEKYKTSAIRKQCLKIGLTSLKGLISSLETAVRMLKCKARESAWSEYYCNTNYSDAAFQDKLRLVEEYLQSINPTTVWDLGANIGAFSEIASRMGINTLAFDSDPVAVERCYIEVKRRGDTYVLPLRIDLTNPTPGIGWGNKERMSLSERGPADTVMALALVHHLAIGNNLPFDHIASHFYRSCNTLIIEFIPKDDSQVQLLLSTREDIFRDYSRQVFESNFNRYFDILRSDNIKDSKRILYLMRRR